MFAALAMFGTIAMFAALAMFGTIAMFCRPCHVLPPLRGFDGGFVFEGLKRPRYRYAASARL
jgi:hypothetical protein